MAAKKPRKRAYTPPPVEVENRKSRSGRAGRRSKSPDGPEYYTLPNGRQVRVPPEPSLKRVLAQLPLYIIIMVGITYVFPPKGVTTTDERLLSGLIQGGLVAIMITPMLLWMDRRRYAMYLRMSGQHVSASTRGRGGKSSGEDGEVEVIETDADAGFRE